MIQSFVGTPLGVLCLLVICCASMINVYAHWIEDGLIGRALYMAAALVCAAGLLGAANVGPALVVLFALLSIRNVVMRTSRYFRFRRSMQHAKKHL